MTALDRQKLAAEGHAALVSLELDLRALRGMNRYLHGLVTAQATVIDELLSERDAR